jgi:hypothetical protein
VKLLGEAIRQGRAAKDDDPAIDNDPIIMALKGLGVLPLDLDDCHSYPTGGWQPLAYPKEALVKVRPWLNEGVVCQWCGHWLKGPEIVSHPISAHADEIELEGECGWLDEMEEEPEARRSGLAVYFPTPEERRCVLDAAQRLLVSPSDFIAAALRLVLEYRIRLECPSLPQ